MSQHAPTRYQQAADSIAELIANGAFPPGSKVPSLRRLSRQLSVSVSTAQEAYRLLEDRGLIEARPQSGYFVRCPLGQPPQPEKTVPNPKPVELSLCDLALRVMRPDSEPALVSFGAAVPHASFLPTAALNRILAREIKRHPETSQGYDQLRGFEPLRTQIARRCLDAGCSVAPDDIVTTNGAQQAVYLALRAITRPGDTVAIETPTYVGLLQVLEELGLKAREIATDPDDGICLEGLAAAIAAETIAACVVVPTFGNPLGHCMPVEAKRALVALLADAGVPLIEDHVYGDLAFSGDRPHAAKSFDRDGTVILCSSYSKTLAPGYRVGWMAPGRFTDAVLRQKYVASIASATPPQMAVAAFLEGGGYDRHLRRLRGTYQSLVTRVSAAVGEHFPEGTRISRPNGGHVVWVELPPEIDSVALWDQALGRGISFAPGPLFSARGAYRNFIRLNCAVPWSEITETALRTLGGLATR